jgi:hypothetical protein
VRVTDKTYCVVRIAYCVLQKNIAPQRREDRKEDRRKEEKEV